MTNSGEKLCLQWNDFRENVSSSFGDLRGEKEFSDVTLACEEGHQVEAHKVVLLASSPFFLNILKRNKHSHPLIYMRGVKSENLTAMMDFLYHGEANVFQENLDSFLVLADELQLKGLGGNQREKEGSEQFSPPENKKGLSTPPTLPKPNTLAKQNRMDKEASIKTEIVQLSKAQTAIVLTDGTTNKTDIESLNHEVKSMMMVSDNGLGRARICKVCGKEGSWKHIRDHIEANHIDGISIPCDLCGKSFKSRNNLSAHKSRHT